MRLTSTLLCVGLALGGVGCADEFLRLPDVYEAPPPPDNPNTLRGTFCATDPSTILFPVKIPFVIDDTGSMTTNDPNQRRFVESKALATRLKAPGQMFFGGMTFSSDHMNIILNNPRFTDDVDKWNTGVDGVMNKAQGGTPYVTTLDRTYSELIADINDDVSKARRTKYVLIFLSDGEPQPPEPDDQILSKVDQLLGLAGQVGGVVLNSVFLGNPTPGTSDRLQGMAVRGKGIFKSFPNGDSLDYTGFDFTGIRRTYIQRNFFVANRSMLPLADGQKVDSDGDGLPDDVELREYGSDPTLRDTDGDGCGDLLEARSGWDPKIPGSMNGQCKCPVAELVDSDHDGLNDCEERLIGSDRRDPDSDLDVSGKVAWDKIPDGVDYIYMNDVTLPNVASDRDRDGMTDVAEVEAHTSVFEGDKDRAAWAYRYTRFVPQRDRPRCVDFTVENLALGKTRATADHAENENIVELYFSESAQDSPYFERSFHVARMKIPYAAGGLVVDVKPEDFSETLQVVR